MEETIDNLYQQIVRIEALIDSITALCQKDHPYIKIGLTLGQDVLTLKHIKNEISIVLDNITEIKKIK